MKRFLTPIFVVCSQILAFSAFAGESITTIHVPANTPLRVYDVLKVTCESGAKPDSARVFPAGAVVQMSEDAVNAFANENSDRTSVILRYPIPKTELAFPAPCPAEDVLLIELKKKS